MTPRSHTAGLVSTAELEKELARWAQASSRARATSSVICSGKDFTRQVAVGVTGP
ncbi:hypothetical protein ACFYTF_00485 [Nocardia thailandica]|uniref:Uncharacterized protein n=1 Tax=Nocardia thailandica TaxID=257275 RepID=A0ABW6PFX3_9NOCA